MTNLSHVKTTLNNPIRHVVAFSAKTPQAIHEIEEGLKMLSQIEGVRNFSVARNKKLDEASNEMDVVVYAEFLNEKTLETFKHDPIYQKCTDIVRPLRDKRLVLDF